MKSPLLAAGLVDAVLAAICLSAAVLSAFIPPILVGTEWLLAGLSSWVLLGFLLRVIGDVDAILKWRRRPAVVRRILMAAESVPPGGRRAVARGHPRGVEDETGVKIGGDPLSFLTLFVGRTSSGAPRLFVGFMFPGRPGMEYEADLPWGPASLLWISREIRAGIWSMIPVSESEPEI